ncbi:ABC transporter ATP-binding protein [Allosphingosinicella deserti]|uniref:ABC transporter domain-containing protein n=1 Tax=Allosphingosinicella deserti TaxID=2116704 RepID=A0A2P7QNW2_9SPHN|nr:ABC transporter ATP-binding protein [Sphingomonas deserti]PSJ39646.1 hypothetical protein C7I55_13700 [Sphingomonas deserti]
MSDAPILAVTGLSKRYSRELRSALAYGIRDIAREFLPGRPAALRPNEFWALDDIHFSLGRGEALAVVGHNGAGKSTLLKLLFGLVKPDRGEIAIRGRAEALIELGTGFNPVLSGRENVRVSAAYHALDRRAADRLVDDVADFAELGAFFDAPVQSFSSGMKARLAYAVIAHLKPDLLLVDEALAVGDAAFQRKCVAHMRSYLAEGGSLLLVSHSLHQIQAVCDRGILLEQGRLVFEGSAVETLHRMFETRPVERGPSAAPGPSDEAPVAIEALLVEGEAQEGVATDQGMRLTVRYQCRQPVTILWVFAIWTDDQWTCVTGAVAAAPTRLEPGRGELHCVVPRLPLLPGHYVVKCSFNDAATLLPLALHGWKDAGTGITVKGEPTATAVAMARMNALVKIDVDWR